MIIENPYKERFAEWRRRYYYANRAKKLARKWHYYHEQQARKRGANAITSPGNGGPSSRKKADGVNLQER